MIIEPIRELLAREPFQPFRVRASSGAAFDVRNPHLVVPLKSQLFIATPNSDRVALIPYLHMASVELLGNGHPSRPPRRRRPR